MKCANEHKQKQYYICGSDCKINNDNFNKNTFVAKMETFFNF